MSKQITADFKLKFALEAIKVENSIEQLATFLGINPNKHLEEGIEVFKDKRSKDLYDMSPDALLKIIEEQRMELEFLKRKLLSLEENETD